MSVIFNSIYQIVQSIPKGRVLTYGLISHMIGGRMSAQGVGWALKALGSAKRTERSAKKSPNASADKTEKKKVVPYNSATVPWQRVVNAEGGTSTHKVPGIPPDLQRQLLQKEGIAFNDEGKLDLTKYLWMEGVGKTVSKASSVPTTKLKRTPKPEAKSKSGAKPHSKPTAKSKSELKPHPKPKTKSKSESKLHPKPKSKSNKLRPASKLKSKRD